MALSLPAEFSICARSFGAIYATDGDPAYWFPDDCVATNLSNSRKQTDEKREVRLSIHNMSSDLATWPSDQGVRSTQIAGIEVLYFETSEAFDNGDPMTNRTLHIEFETDEGWVSFLADANTTKNQTADTSYAWVSFEAFVKSYHSN